MKRMMLSLVMACLVGSLTQAQTPKVKKLWEKKFESEVIACVVDTTNGGKEPLVYALEGGKLRTLDRQGAEIKAVSLPQPGKIWWSSNLKYFGTFPNGVIVDCNGGSICSTPAFKDINIGFVEIANDGRAFTIVSQTGSVRPGATEPVSYFGAADTLWFYDGKGQLKKVIPVPFEQIGGSTKNRFSGDGSRFVVLDQSLPRLRIFDREGNLVWQLNPQKDHVNFSRLSYSFSSKGGLFLGNYEAKFPGYKGWSGRTAWGRFYDPDGRLENKLQLDVVDTVKYKYYFGVCALSANGEYGLFGAGGSGEFLMKVSKIPPKVIWRYEVNDPTHQTTILDAQISSSGEYALAQIRCRKKWNKIVVFDAKGNLIFEDEKAPFWDNEFSDGGNFFVSYYSNTIALYEIVSQ